MLWRTLPIRQNVRLHCGPDCYGFVRFDALKSLAAKMLFNKRLDPLDPRDMARSTDEDDVVKFSDVGFLENIVDQRNSLFEEIYIELLGLCAGSSLGRVGTLIILAAKKGITGGGKKLENATIDQHERDFERFTTKIADNNVAKRVVHIFTVGCSNSGGLVYNSENVKTGNPTAVFNGLMKVLEIS